MRYPIIINYPHVGSCGAEFGNGYFIGSHWIVARTEHMQQFNPRSLVVQNLTLSVSPPCHTSAAPSVAATSPAVPKPLPSSNTRLSRNSPDLICSKHIHAASTLHFRNIKTWKTTSVSKLTAQNTSKQLKPRPWKLGSWCQQK